MSRQGLPGAAAAAAAPKAPDANATATATASEPQGRAQSAGPAQTAKASDPTAGARPKRSATSPAADALEMQAAANTKAPATASGPTADVEARAAHPASVWPKSERPTPEAMASQAMADAAPSSSATFAASESFDTLRQRVSNAKALANASEPKADATAQAADPVAAEALEPKADVKVKSTVPTPEDLTPEVSGSLPVPAASTSRGSARVSYRSQRSERVSARLSGVGDTAGKRSESPDSLTVKSSDQATAKGSESPDLLTVQSSDGTTAKGSESHDRLKVQSSDGTTAGRSENPEAKLAIPTPEGLAPEKSGSLTVPGVLTSKVSERSSDRSQTSEVLKSGVDGMAESPTPEGRIRSGSFERFTPQHAQTAKWSEIGERFSYRDQRSPRAEAADPTSAEAADTKEDAAAQGPPLPETDPTAKAVDPAPDKVSDAKAKESEKVTIPLLRALKEASPVPAAAGGETVWYQIDGPGEWAPCKVVDRQPGGAVKLKIKNTDVVVHAEDVPSRILPRHGQLTDNLAELPRNGLGPKGVEDILRQHFCRPQPYTRIADVIVAVNPMRDIPIYDAKWVDRYAELKPSLPPHVFTAAAMAYKALTEKKMSQAIFITGRPGSGKSEAMEHLLSFLAQTAGSDPVDEMLTKVGVVLRPFISIGLENGDLKWSSTRALLTLEVCFDEDDFICRATAAVQLLESRAARPGESANFDVFSKALRDREESKKWLGEQEEFRLLEDGFDLEEYDSDGSQLEEWKKALKMFKIESADIVRYLCALLLLGQVTFSSMAGEVTCSGHEEAAKALGVEAPRLAAELVRAGDVDAAKGKLLNTIEDLYRGLVTWTLQKVNAAMVGDSQPTELTLTIVDAPAFPSNWPATLSAPVGFDAVQLQWFTEALKAQLITAALQSKVQEEKVMLDISSLGSAKLAEATLGAIEGPKGFIAKIRELSQQTRPPTKSDFEEWSKQFKASRFSMRSTQTSNSCMIRGAAGAVQHELDSRLVLGSLGPSTPNEVRALLTKSSFKPLVQILATRMEPATVRSDLDEATDAVKTIQSMLAGKGIKGKLRPWLVCCMRPNDKGSAKLVSQSVLQAQVEELLLSDMIHLAANTQVPYSVAWSLNSFQKQYAPLLIASATRKPENEPYTALVEWTDDILGGRSRTDDSLACRNLVDCMGANMGTVGTDGVYGTADLPKALDKMRQEDTAATTIQAAWRGGTVRDKVHKEDAAATRIQASWRGGTVRDKKNAAAGAPSMPVATSQSSSSGAATHVPAVSIEAPAVSEEDDLRARILAALTGALNSGEMARAVTTVQGRRGVDRSTSMSSGAPETSSSISSGKVPVVPPLPDRRPSGLGEAMGNEDSFKKSIGSAEARRSGPARNSTRDVIPFYGDPDILPGLPREPPKRGPMRFMALPQHVILHSALSQMGAVLRVTKQNETTLRKGKSSIESELQELSQECNAWRTESDRLWGQVKELEQLVGEEPTRSTLRRSPSRGSSRGL